MDLAVLALVAALEGAPLMQTGPVQNPTRVEFNCPDHALDDQHEMDIISVVGTNRVVIQTLLLGDPAVNASGIVAAPINVQPYQLGDYVVRLRAVAGGIKSPDSVDSNTWQRTLFQPVNPVVAR